MVNYSCAFSQSELGKYFERIIKLLKAKRKGKKSKQGFEDTPGNRTRKLPNRKRRN